jgi:glutamyl-Q tRNA(Asp) synthetase
MDLNAISQINGAITRFAPTPSGYLHLGHAYSAFFAERAARSRKGKFALRIENNDKARCLEKYERALLDDLSWLGLSWENPVRRQLDHTQDYLNGISKLKDMGIIYPCFCSRKEIWNEVNRISNAPHNAVIGGLGPIYPGTCRSMTLDEQENRILSGHQHAFRLDTMRAIQIVRREQEDFHWEDLDYGKQAAKPEIFGDFIIARKDRATSYHLSVVIDDAAQSVDLVTRGDDLRDVTHIHFLLQKLLKLETPRYQFHRLLLDNNGKRYAKRDNAQSLRVLRAQGITPVQIIKSFGFT